MAHLYIYYNIVPCVFVYNTRSRRVNSLKRIVYVSLRMYEAKSENTACTRLVDTEVKKQK